MGDFADMWEHETVDNDDHENDSTDINDGQDSERKADIHEHDAEEMAEDCQLDEVEVDEGASQEVPGPQKGLASRIAKMGLEVKPASGWREYGSIIDHERVETFTKQSKLDDEKRRQEKENERKGTGNVIPGITGILPRSKSATKEATTATKAVTKAGRASPPLQSGPGIRASPAKGAQNPNSSLGQKPDAKRLANQGIKLQCDENPPAIRSLRMDPGGPSSPLSKVTDFSRQASHQLNLVSPMATRDSTLLKAQDTHAKGVSGAEAKPERSEKQGNTEPDELKESQPHSQESNVGEHPTLRHNSDDEEEEEEEEDDDEEQEKQQTGTTQGAGSNTRQVNDMLFAKSTVSIVQPRKKKSNTMMFKVKIASNDANTPTATKQAAPVPVAEADKEMEKKKATPNANITAGPEVAATKAAGEEVSEKAKEDEAVEKAADDEKVQATEEEATKQEDAVETAEQETTNVAPASRPVQDSSSSSSSSDSSSSSSSDSDSDRETGRGVSNPANVPKQKGRVPKRMRQKLVPRAEKEAAAKKKFERRDAGHGTVDMAMPSDVCVDTRNAEKPNEENERSDQHSTNILHKRKENIEPQVEDTDVLPGKVQGEVGEDQSEDQQQKERKQNNEKECLEDKLKEKEEKDEEDRKEEKAQAMAKQIDDEEKHDSQVKEKEKEREEKEKKRDAERKEADAERKDRSKKEKEFVEKEPTKEKEKEKRKEKEKEKCIAGKEPGKESLKERSKPQKGRRNLGKANGRGRATAKSKEPGNKNFKNSFWDFQPNTLKWRWKFPMPDESGTKIHLAFSNVESAKQCVGTKDKANDSAQKATGKQEGCRADFQGLTEPRRPAADTGSEGGQPTSDDDASSDGDDLPLSQRGQTKGGGVRQNEENETSDMEDIRLHRKDSKKMSGAMKKSGKRTRGEIGSNANGGTDEEHNAAPKPVEDQPALALAATKLSNESSEEEKISVPKKKKMNKEIKDIPRKQESVLKNARTLSSDTSCQEESLKAVADKIPKKRPAETNAAEAEKETKDVSSRIPKKRASSPVQDVSGQADAKPKVPTDTGYAKAPSEIYGDGTTGLRPPADSERMTPPPDRKTPPPAEGRTVNHSKKFHPLTQKQQQMHKDLQEEGRQFKGKAKSCSNDLKNYYHLLAGLKFFRAAEIRRLRTELMQVDKFFQISYKGFLTSKDYLRSAMARKCSAMVHFYSSTIQKQNIKSLRENMMKIEKPAGLEPGDVTDKLSMLNKITEAVDLYAEDSEKAYTYWDDSVIQEQNARDAGQRVLLQIAVKDCTGNKPISLEKLEERILQAAVLPNAVSPGEKADTTGSEERGSTSTAPKDQERAAVPALRERASASMDVEPSKDPELERREKSRIEDLEHSLEREKERDRQREQARRQKEEAEREAKLKEQELKREMKRRGVQEPADGRADMRNDARVDHRGAAQGWPGYRAPHDRGRAGALHGRAAGPERRPKSPWGERDKFNQNRPFKGDVRGARPQEKDRKEWANERRDIHRDKMLEESGPESARVMSEDIFATGKRAGSTSSEGTDTTTKINEASHSKGVHEATADDIPDQAPNSGVMEQVVDEDMDCEDDVYMEQPATAMMQEDDGFNMLEDVNSRDEQPDDHSQFQDDGSKMEGSFMKDLDHVRLPATDADEDRERRPNDRERSWQPMSTGKRDFDTRDSRDGRDGREARDIRELSREHGLLPTRERSGPHDRRIGRTTNEYRSRERDRSRDRGGGGGRDAYGDHRRIWNGSGGRDSYGQRPRDERRARDVDRPRR